MSQFSFGGGPCSSTNSELEEEKDHIEKQNLQEICSTPKMPMPEIEAQISVKPIKNDIDPKNAHSYLSIFTERDITGIALYIPNVNMLTLSQLTGNFENTISCISSFEPDVILFPKTGKSNPIFDRIIQLNVSEKIIQLKSNLFDYEQTISKLKNNIDKIFTKSEESIPLIEKSSYSQNNSVRLRNYIDLDKKYAIRAFGGLLNYLDLNNNTSLIRIKTVRDINNSGQVQISYKSLHDLQVFSEDLHPSLIKGTGKSKEGLSLFSLLDFTLTQQGRRKLQTILMTPLTDITRIIERQKIIEFFIELKDIEIINEITDSLSKISELDKIFEKFSQAIAQACDWTKLYTSLIHGLRLIQIIKFECLANSANYNNILFNEMKSLNTDSLIELEEKIASTIDIEETRRFKKIQIKSGVSEELDQVRYQYSNISEFLTKIAVNIQTLIPHEKFSFLKQFYLTYLPLLGYMISIPKGEIYNDFLLRNAPNATNSDIANLLTQELPEWEFVFASEEALYFRNDVTKTLDEEVGDLHGQICEITGKILREIEELIIAKSSELCSFSYLLGDFDAMFSLFLAASEYQLVRPEIIDQPGIDIIKGRHLLTEQITTPFIPNDCSFPKNKRMILVTGPNSSGKSIYIKQVGLIVILALCGCYVPAEKAKIGMFKKILTKFPGKETISSGLSFFTHELSEINNILKQSDENTLILVDEFSRGTQHIDGIALFGSIATAFSNPKIFEKIKNELKCPKSTANGNTPFVLATTHCYELYLYKLMDFSKIELLQMQVVTSKVEKEKTSEEQEDANIVCLFKIAPGVCCNSRPIYAALLAKLYIFIVKRAWLVERFFSEQIMKPLHGCIGQIKKKYISVLKQILGKSDISQSSIANLTN